MTQYYQNHLTLSLRGTGYEGMLGPLQRWYYGHLTIPNPVPGHFELPQDRA
jgi:hypothetical protein